MTLEDRLIAATEAGTVLDLAYSGRPDRAEMESWGPDRTIEASLIRDVLLGRKAPQADPHGIQLRGLRISGPLDLYNMQSDLDLSLSDCLVEGGVVLRGARLRSVSFVRCVILAGVNRTCLDGGQLLASTLNLGQSTLGASDGECAIDLRGAQVDGQLVLSGAQLNGRDSDGHSLIGDRVTVGGGMFLRTRGSAVFTSAGAIRLPGAHIGGQLDLSGAQLNGHDTGGNSLIGDRLTIDGGMFVRPSDESTFTAAGAIRLAGADVHGPLDLSGAQLNGHDTNGDSLIGDGFTVDGIFVRSSGKSTFTAAGAIRLPRAHIHGQLWVALSSLGSAQSVALSLEGASVGELSLDLATPLNADVRVDLQDATYTGLPRLGNLEQWLMLLSRHTVAYTPQAYQQLATAHRSAGHERDARRILIAQQEDRRRRVVRADEGANRWTRFRFWARRTGLWLQRVTIGYGYRTWPAFVGVLLLAALGAGLGIAAGHTRVATTKQFAAYRPASTVQRVSQNCSIVEQASLGVRVPFLSSLGAGDCVLNTASVPGEVYSVAIWTDQALAWAAATLAVAGYTGLVRRT